MYKNNSRDGSKFKGFSPYQLSCNLTGKYHAIGYYSYTNRYPPFEMKHLLSLILLVSNLTLLGQNEEEMTVEIQGIDTTDVFYNYYTFDTTAIPKQNVIAIRQLWVDKADTSKTNRLRLGQSYIVNVDPIGPEKGVWDGDTVHYRGHARFSSIFIDGQRIDKKRKQKKNSEFIPEEAIIRIDYYELKKIRNGG